MDTLGRYGFLHSILDADSPVKAQKRDQTETSQFRHWFGKSKVVDEDGNPLVVYHGTDAEFDVFEMDRWHADHKSRGFSTVTIAAPVTIGGVRSNVGVVVKQIGRNLYKTHRVIMPDGSAFTYEIKMAEPRPLEGAAAEGPHAPGKSSATDSVARSNNPVNPNSTQDSGKQYAVGDVGFWMFGNETAQRLDTLTQTVKDALKGTTYEKDTNAEQVDRAQKIIDRDGLSETIDSLLTKSQEEWSADEHALGALCMVLANQPGRVDPIRAMAIAQVYNEAGTKAGKALQVRQIVGKLTPSGAMLGAVQNAKAANEKKGIGGNAIPMGNEAPKGKNRKRAGKSGTTVAPM